jgi:hypothetical protein
LDNNSSTWQLATDANAIEQHYKKHKKAYKKYEADMKLFRDEELPRQQYFLDALQASISADDPNLPENVAAAQEEETYDFRQIGADYKAWLNETIGELEKVDSTEEGALIDIALLENNQDKALDAPQYATVFWKAVGDQALKDIQAIGGQVSYLQARDLVKEALISHYNQIVTDDFLRTAVESGEDVMPHGLKGWLKESTNKRENLKEAFAQSYLSWTKEVAKVVAICENQNRGKTFTVDLKKFRKELVERFNYSVNGVQPGEQLLPILQKALPQNKTANFTQLLGDWKDGVVALQDQDLVSLLWEQYLTSKAGEQSIQEVVNNFIAKLPSQESLINALLDARYYAPKKKLPTNKKPLLAAFKVEHANKEQGFNFFVRIPIVYKAMKNHAGEDWYQALPNPNKEKYFVEVPDSLSYEVDKSSFEIEVHTPQYSVNENSYTATTGMTFYLSVRDTKIRNVVAPGGNGKFNLLTVDPELQGKLKKGLANLGVNSGFLELKAELDLLGNKEGKVSALKFEINIGGFPVQVYYYPDKKWPANIKMSSPKLLAYRKKKMLESYGGQTYDMKFYAELYSVRAASSNSTQYASIINGREGSVTWDERGETSRREDVKVTFIGGVEYKVVLQQEQD